VRVLLVCLVLGLAGLAGCTDFSEYEPTNQIGLVRIDIAAPVVSTGSVTLTVLSTLDNLAAPSGQLNLTVRAFDLATNMLVATTRVEVGQLEKDRAKEVAATLVLPRTSGYRIEIAVGQDGRTVQEGTVTVNNVMALEPTVYDTGLRISEVDVQVLDAKDAQVRIKASTYLTNEGAQASRPLRLQIKARELSTGVLADEKWVDLAAVPPDATRIATTELVMPDEFNYELLAYIWDGDIIVERGHHKVQFLHTYTQDTTQKLVVTNADISLFKPGPGGGGDFAYDGDGRGDYYGGAPSYTGSPTTPGPGFLAVLAVLAVTLILWRRYKR